MSFDDDQIDLSALKATAYNHRWAEAPDGVIPLTAADSDFGAPPIVRAALSAYAQRGHFGYAPPFGLPEFRSAVASFFSTRRDAAVPAEHIMATNGAASAVFLAARTVIAPGTSALVPDPCDFLLPASIEAAGGRVVRYPVVAGRALQMSDLESLIDSSTSAIFLCNPHNPLGFCHTAAEIDAVLALARARNLAVISDEVWSDIVFPPARFTSALARLQDGDRLLVIGGFSKSYALAGLRTGFLATGDANLAARAGELSRQALTVDGAGTAGQVAAVAALEGCGDWLQSYLAFLQARRDQCIAALAPVVGGPLRTPDATHVLLVPLPAGCTDAEAVAATMMSEHKVAVVPGTERWFGPAARGHFRISYATSERILADALTRIVRAF